jgi:hypothetical protein
MRSAALAAHRPLSFAGRLATAFVELVLASAVIVAAIVGGHQLREWRDWYPTVYHPWLDGRESAPEVTEP